MRAIMFGALAALLTVSCLDDEDRCTGDYTWDAETKKCLGPEDEGVDGGGGGDGGDTSGTGEYCESDSDCVEYDADYCLMDGPSATTGTCTVQGCSSDADCFLSYVCCITPSIDQLPDVCINDDMYAEFGSLICEG